MMGPPRYDRPRLFLTCAEADLSRVRPVAARLTHIADLTIDFGVTSQRLATRPCDILRTSLALRLNRCSAALCLFTPQTLADLWVRWSLHAAGELGIPLLGAPLDGDAAEEDCSDLLEGFGVRVLPLRPEVIAHHIPGVPAPRTRDRDTVGGLLLALQAMRNVR
jgi:hypothetical protein